MPGKWLMKIASAVLLAIGTFGIAFYSVAGHKADQSANPAAEGYGQTPGVSELAKFDLTDQHGKRLTGNDLKNKLVMMNFFFTGCTGACPVQTAVLRNVHQGLDPDLDVLFVSVSIAPLTDTKVAIDEYIDKFDVDSANWKFAIASVQNSEKLIKRFGVTVDGAIVEEGKLDHRNMGYLYNKQGRLMQQYQLVPGMDERFIREITELDTLEFETS